MCEPMTIMAGVGMATAALGAGQQAKASAAAETARRKNLREAVRQSNYQDAALQIQDKQNHKAARREISGISLEQIRANGAVKTAIGESNLEGRTMERVATDVDNSFLRAAVDVQRNYDTDYTNTWAEREAVRNNLIATVEGSAPVAAPSKLGTALDIIGAGVSGAATGNTLEDVYSKTVTARGKSQTK